MIHKSSHIPLYELHGNLNSDLYIRKLQDHDSERLAYQAAHRDDYYIFLFQQSGNSLFWVDFKEIELPGSCIYLIHPGQVHRLLSVQNTEGWLLATNPLLIDEGYRNIIEEEGQLLLPLAVDRDTRGHFKNIMQTIFHMLSATSTINYPLSILKHIVSACAGSYIYAYSLQSKSITEHKSQPTAIAHKFRSLVRQKYHEVKSPAQYANMLHLSLTYLNECVKNVSGKPVSYWIQYEVFLEAKRLLIYDTLTIMQIAYKLGYEDQAYFSRQFTKFEGISPAGFRKKYHE